MRLLSITILLAVVLLLTSNVGFGQGPCPPEPCAACIPICDTNGLCSAECINCVATPAPGGCQGAGVPISDHAGILLAGGLILISVYSIRRRKLELRGDSSFRSRL